MHVIWTGGDLSCANGVSDLVVRDGVMIVFGEGENQRVHALREIEGELKVYACEAPDKPRLNEGVLRHAWDKVEDKLAEGAYGLPQYVSRLLATRIADRHAHPTEGGRPFVDEIVALLLRKNELYGNSALDPVRVLSKASAVEQLRVRADDKISRIMRGTAGGEDTELDLLGYLVLLEVAELVGL